MEQSVTDKLMELKRLYEAGILTKEELEDEKRKVLGNAEGTQHNEIVVQESVSASLPPTEKDNKKGLWIGIGFVVLVLFAIICVVVSNNKNTTDDYDYYDDTVTDCVSDDEDWEDTDTYEESIDTDDKGIVAVLDIDDDDDLYEIDEWVGTYVIRGEIYRLSSSMAILTLKKTERKSYYTGTLCLMLGDDMGDGKFDSWHGKMTANVKAKLQNKQMVVVLEDFTIGEGYYKDWFDSFKQGQQIFCITNSYGTYSVRALEEMEIFFDNSDSEIYKQ